MSPNVLPVIDYEPPSFGGPPALPRCPVRRRIVRDQPARPRNAAEEVRARAAATFADAALRRVLEVIERRRPVAQLRPLLAAGLADSLLATARAIPAWRSPATTGQGTAGRRAGRRGVSELRPRRTGARHRLPHRADQHTHRAALAGGRAAHGLRSAGLKLPAAQQLSLLALGTRGLLRRSLRLALAGRATGASWC